MLSSQKKHKLFIVEDDDWYNRLLAYTIDGFDFFEITRFFNAKDLLKELHQMPDVVTLDFRLPDMDGDELLKIIKDNSEQTEVIIVSEQRDIHVAMSLLRKGAFEYIVKNEEVKEQLHHAIKQIKEKIKLKDRVEKLEHEVDKKYNFNNIILGESKEIQNVITLIKKTLDTSIPVMITGATGTGKEVTARAIHYNSKQKKNPFVVINMAAIPENLLESELFGYEKGAFTGATQSKKGKFEEADGGTLFLDEIGELDINLQAKLLRVIQEKEVTRLGNNKPIKINCRIITATNKNLKEEVRKSHFREDLYYRIKGLAVELPDLKDRGKDVLLLAKHFIRTFAKENGMNEKSLTKKSIDKLLNYPWPGNIRQLKAVIDLAMVMSSSDTITDKDIDFDTIDIKSDLINGKDMSLREFNVALVKHYMNKFNDNTKKVAEQLQIGQTTVYRLLKEGEV